jgi:uncharacterized protein (TIGR02996 family)
LEAAEVKAHDAFLKDIIEHPEDDSVRLIYADYLEENGDPTWAEFIRRQMAGELLPYGVQRWLDKIHWLGSMRGMRWVRCVLPPGHSYSWDGPCFPKQEGRECYAKLWGVKFTFRRGFVERLGLCVKTWLELHAEMRAGTPLRGVDFLDWPAMDAGVRLVEQTVSSRLPLITYGVLLDEPLPGGYQSHLLERLLPPDFPEAQLRGEACAKLYAASWPGITFTFPDRLPS